MKPIITIIFVCALICFSGAASAYVIDHNCTDITQIPESAINTAKTNLHIAYGHTSHGSQLTTGMAGLVAFANGGGLGLSLPDNIFAYNNGGSGGALDLHDRAMGGDCGYYPQWVNNTRAYLSNPANSDVNVIIWSWCGQVSGKYANGTLNSEYLTPMNILENEYPNVTFVYMTGHVDISNDANNKAANQTIRDYCITNNKVLYDFADIERYDPDDNYYEFVHDNCNYYNTAGGTLLGNWAENWQNSHTVNVDWYNCTSAHSRPLNANRKAYGAWWLWARIAGWDGGSDTEAPSVPQNLNATAASSTRIDLSWDASTDNVAVTGYRIFRDGTEIATTASTTYNNTGLTPSTTYQYRVTAYDAAGNESSQSAPASATTQASTGDTEAPSIPQNLTATAASQSQIDITWDTSTDNVAVTGYRIFRDGTEIATTASSTYNNTGLNASTTYSYTVTAYDAAGNESSQSAPASATTQDDGGSGGSGSSGDTGEDSDSETGCFIGTALGR